MKVFLIHPRESSWEQYDSCVVIADSKETVEKMFRPTPYGAKKFVGPHHSKCRNVYGPLFEKEQGDLIFEEVDLTEEGLLSTYFIKG